MHVKSDQKGLGETETVAIAVTGSVLLLALLVCLLLVCYRRFFFQRINLYLYPGSVATEGELPLDYAVEIMQD